MSVSGSTSFDKLRLDDDVYYPVPTGRTAVHKLPKEMNRHDRRAVLRVVERCVRHSIAHPYKGRMQD
jgi:hypothetical protein